MGAVPSTERTATTAGRLSQKSGTKFVDMARAVALWRQLLKEHADSREADRAAYYIGVVYRQTKRWQEAKTAYESLLKERPESAFVKLTKEQLKQVDRELSRAGR